MMNTLKKEFSVQKLLLNLDHGDSVCESWVLPPWALLLLRLCIATFCVTIMIVSIAQGADSRWLIYLTNWSYLLLTTSMIGLTLISIFHVLENRKDSENNLQREMYVMKNTQISDAQITVTEITDTELSMPLDDDGCIVTSSLVWYEKTVWFLWVISANAGLVVTIEYWLLVFRPPTSFMDISVHALNSLFILTEIFTGKLPVRILHSVYVMVFCIIYAVFTIIYWAAGGVNGRGDPFIYHILDYENGKPGSIAAVLLCSVFIVAPLVQFILYGLHRIRLRLDKKKNTMYSANNNNVNNVII